MEMIIQAAAVIAAFAAVHERVLELMRNWLVKQWKVMSEDQFDRRNMLFAVGLALVTHANLLELFTPVTRDGAPTLLFFEHYMDWDDVLADWKARGGIVSNVLRDALGCTLMGFATAFGAKFWHDAIKSIASFRQQARSIGKLTDLKVQQPAVPASASIATPVNPQPETPPAPPSEPPARASGSK
ncbi:hypothetical protein [Archangium lipolyticum]|uniref:hypothetical protein n=1 Tax=Archangium lipolyticum TaxID=2970465 RepID=UPI00214A1E74|nr:hypothetical protein [Archangium lipolyticum]